MELPSKLSEQDAFITRPKIEEHLLVVMDKSTHKEHSSEPIQTDNKQIIIAVAFLTVSNGIFKVTDKNKKLFFAVSINYDDFNVSTIPPGTLELESLNDEIKRFII